MIHNHADDFLIMFSRFQTDHPRFIQYTNFTEKTVIIMQTPWMKSQLHELLRDDNKILGLSQIQLIVIISLDS
jgi:hypothetical protein